ncbi:MAG: hypothetical protein HFJ20_08115 [Clostridia bacterium]|nr:hypothetical protein [Clostridia bacterium]
MEHDLEKKYYEKLALKLLKYTLDIDITNFKDKEEPDWHNDKDSVGIEVTIVDESLRFYRELEKVDKVDANKVKKFNKRYIKNGGRIITKKEADCMGLECSFKFNDNYVYIIPAYDNNFENINKAIKNKTEKLNNNYKLFKQNGLFIFSHIRTRKELFKEELNEIIKIQSKSEKKFDFIYICLTDCIVIFDLKNNVCNVKEFDKNKFNNIAFEISE